MMMPAGVSVMDVDKEGYYTLQDIQWYKRAVKITLIERGKGRANWECETNGCRD